MRSVLMEQFLPGFPTVAGGVDGGYCITTILTHSALAYANGLAPGLFGLCMIVSAWHTAHGFFVIVIVHRLVNDRAPPT